MIDASILSETAQARALGFLVGGLVALAVLAVRVARDPMARGGVKAVVFSRRKAGDERQR